MISRWYDSSTMIVYFLYKKKYEELNLMIIFLYLDHSCVTHDWYTSALFHLFQSH
jgi:hypothetical protein